MTKTSLTRPLCTLCYAVLPHTIRTSLYHIPLALLDFLSPLSSLPVFFPAHTRLLRMQRFSLRFFSHHQNFPLRCFRHYLVLLQSLLFLVTPLYGSSSAPAPVLPCRAPFLRCRDTQLPLHTLLPYVYKQRTPLLLLDTCFFSHPNFLPSFMMFLLGRNSASYGHCQIAARLPFKLHFSLYWYQQHQYNRCCCCCSNSTPYTGLLDRQQAGKRSPAS